MSPSFLEQPVEPFLELVAAREPAPGGGAVAAVTVASAAALAGMAARFADRRLRDSGRLTARADRFRHRALALARADAASYSAVLAAYALPRGRTRQEQVRRALLTAAEVPLTLAGLAAKVAQLALLLAEDGNSNLKGDALTAILLAEAAAQAAAALVRINVQAGELGPELPEQAGRCARATECYRERATSLATA